MIFTRNQSTSPQQSTAQGTHHWVQVAEALARRWELLTVADLAQIQQRLSRLAEIVQQRYELSMDDARQQVAAFEASLENEAKIAYAALGAKMTEIKARGSKLRHDINEFGWQVTSERLIMRYPGYAVGIAAALGAVVGAAIGAGITAATRPARRW